MKKIIFLLTCLALILVMAVGVFADGETTKIVSATSAEMVEVEKEITVTVSIEDCEPFIAIGLTPVYDPDVFEIVSGEWLFEDAFIATFNGKDAAAMFAAETTKNEAVFEYTLKVKTDAVVGDTVIKTNAVIKNGANDVPCTVSEVTVKATCIEHTFGEWVIVGEKHEHTCTACGFVENFDHVWGEPETTKPETCLEKGEELFTCTVCGATKTGERAALEHDLVAHEAQAATCTEIGWEAYDTCSRCDYTTYVEIAALGHDPKEAVEENHVDPTCTEAGSYDMVVYCNRCEAELSRETSAIKALGHTEVIDKAVEPTTFGEGKTEGKHCSVCNTVLEAQKVVPALGIFTAWWFWLIIVVVVAAVVVCVVFIIKKKKGN